MDFAKLSEAEKEITTGGPTRKDRNAADWIPRPPAKFELKRHRSPITRVIFHPHYNYMVSCSEDATVMVGFILILLFSVMYTGKIVLYKSYDLHGKCRIYI
jgi:WD40 repeat protein